MKVEKDAENEAYNAFIGATSRHKIRFKAFQVGSNSSTSTSSKSNSESEESDSSDEEEDMAMNYPQEDSDSEADENSYKPRSP